MLFCKVSRFFKYSREYIIKWNVCKSDKYKLYRNSCPDRIKFIFFDNKNNKLRFKIILFAYVK